MTVKMLLTLVSQTGPIKTPLSLSGDMHIKTSHNNMVSRWSSGDRMKIKKQRILTDDRNYSEDSQYIIIRYSSHDHQITWCFCWYSVRIISWPCINNMLILSDDYLLLLLIFSQVHQLTMCWYTVIIWWLYAVPTDIQSESWVDHVLIICWYTLISNKPQMVKNAWQLNLFDRWWQFWQFWKFWQFLTI